MTTTIKRRWFVSDSDGSTIIVSTLRGDDDVLLEWDGRSWICSECGPQVNQNFNAPATCVHTRTAGRSVPLGVAMTMVATLPRSDPSPKLFATTGKTSADAAAEMALAESLAEGAPARAARVAERDAAYLGITGEITVRPITDADRERIAAARAAKRRRFGEPEPDQKPARFNL